MTPNIYSMLKLPVLLVLLLFTCHVQAENTSPTYLTVNGKAIPQARANLLASMMPTARGTQDTEMLRKALAEELVRRELAAQEAIKRGLNNRPEIQAQIDMATQSVLVNAFISDYLREHPVTEESVKHEYESIRATLGNREYKVRHILLANATEAQAVIDKLDHGAKFADLAKQSLDGISKDRGGELGWINAATYVQPFTEAMSKLKKGTYTSRPVQSEFGWHVILLDDTRELKVPTLTELKPQLLPRLQQQSVERYLSELRAKAQIK